MDFSVYINKLFEWVGIFFTWVGALFTPAQWQAFILEWWNFLLLVVATFAATQVIKILWWAGPLRGGYKGQLNAVAVLVGIAMTPLLFWDNGVQMVIPMVMAGPFSILAFKALGKVWPGAVDALNLNMEAPVKEKADG